MIGISYTNALTLCVGGKGDASCKKQFATIIEAQRFIEAVIPPKEIGIERHIPYFLIYETLEQWCNSSVIEEVQTLLEPLKQSRWNVSNWNIQNEMNKRFTVLTSMISSVKEDDEDLFCKQKYLLYSLLERTQELYNNPSSSKWINVTKRSIENTQTTTTQEHGSADLKESSFDHEYLNLKHITNSLVSEQDWRIATIAPKLIQKEIKNLLDLGFLNEKDLVNLDEKIELQYVRSCGNTKGSFRMTQNVDGTNRKVKAIQLKINLCEDQEYLKTFEKYIRQIFIHELGHYVYYIKDTHTNTFGKICWNNGKNNCTAEQFVSTYAMQNVDEDYAESFAYWYLETISQYEMITDREHGSASVDDTRLQFKNQYFNTLRQ